MREKVDLPKEKKNCYLTSLLNQTQQDSIPFSRQGRRVAIDLPEPEELTTQPHQQKGIKDIEHIKNSIQATYNVDHGMFTTIETDKPSASKTMIKIETN